MALPGRFGGCHDPYARCRCCRWRRRGGSSSKWQLVDDEVLDLTDGSRDGERRWRQTGPRAKAARRFGLPRGGNVTVDGSLKTPVSAKGICRGQRSGWEAGRSGGRREDLLLRHGVDVKSTFCGTARAGEL